MQEAIESGLDRRMTVKALVAGALATGALSTTTNVSAAIAGNAALEQAFRAAFATDARKPANVPTDRLALLPDDALVIDHDIPYPLDRAGYADHLDFHTGNWERIETRFHELRSAIHGSTGIVSAYFIERGKPKNAGFRLRAGYCTAVCALENGQWRALGLHLSPLAGQITDASPG